MFADEPDAAPFGAAPVTEALKPGGQGETTDPRRSGSQAHGGMTNAATPPPGQLAATNYLGASQPDVLA